MTDLDPAQTEAVRRALAAARHTEPMPAEVAARLDATLAELADLMVVESAPQVAAAMVAPAPAEEPRVATVIPFRRRLPVLLAAAAAVTAVAVALPQFIERTGQSDDMAARSVPTVADSSDSLDSADSSDNAESAGKAEAADGHADRKPAAPQPTELTANLNKYAAAVGATELHEATLQVDLRTLLMHRLDARAPFDADALRDNVLNPDVPAPSSGSLNANAQSLTAPRCGPSAPPAGARLFNARFEGHRAVVVAFAATADGTPVQIYDCRIAPRVPTRLLTVPTTG